MNKLYIYETFNSIFAISKAHTRALSIALICGLSWGIVFNQEILDAAKIWWVSEIYSHGFFILPATVYLIWRKREELAKSSPTPAYWAVPIILIFSLLYIIGIAGDIGLFKHAAVFSILPLSIWLIYGTNIIKIILFPLVFILFSIPFGEEFIPVLQKITADISVWMLKSIGIPIFRNGLYIEIPNGRFVVAEACSGVRFFVGATVFGAIYAYINYRSRKKQFIYFAVALIVPIIANSIRVSAIILIGYISGMKYATGTDHLVYGFVFFAIVIMLLVFIGNIWSDRTSNVKEYNVINAHDQWSVRNIATALGVLLVIYTSIFSWAAYINSMKQLFVESADNTNGEIQPVQDEYWKPIFKNPSRTTYKAYRLPDNQVVDFYSAYYRYNTPKTELISSMNHIYNLDEWTLKNTSAVNISSAAGKVDAQIYSLAGASSESRIILYWYEIGNLRTYKQWLVKLYQAYDALIGKPGGARIIILSSKYTEESEAVLRENLVGFARKELHHQRL